MIPKRLSLFIIPSLADVVFLFILLLLAIFQGNSLLHDGDTGYHIRAGEFIIETWSVPQHDIFSFHTPAIPWTAHEWLSEVVMAILHQWFGLTGVVIFFSCLIASIYYLMFRQLRKDDGNIFAVVVIVILVFATSHLHWLARPHIFSLLLLVIWYRILDNYEYRGINQLYVLPPLMVLWVNLHGGYITGIILLGIYCFGSLVSCCFNDTTSHTKTLRRFNGYIILLCICLAATLINPYGYHIILFPFNLVGNKYLMANVNEFLSPNFHQLLIFKYLLLLTIALLSCSKKRLNVIELMLVLFFTNMALISIRHVTLFSIVVAPIILKRADELIEFSDVSVVRFFKQRAAGIAEIDGAAKGFFWPLAGLAIVLLLAVQGAISFKFDENIKPVAAVEFFKKEKLPGNMFTNDEFGDYIIYAAWPEYKVFIDGRSDMYGVEKIKEYYKITRIESDFEEILEKYQIDWVMYDADSILSRYLKSSQGWSLIYSDNVAHIYVRDRPQFENLLEKYKNVEPVL